MRTRAATHGVRTSPPVRLIAPVFSARTWLAVVYLLTGLPLAIITFTVIVVGIALGVGLIPLALVGLPILAMALIVCGWFGTLERHRAALMLGVEIPRPVWRIPSGPGWWPRLRALLFDGSRWRQAVAGVAVLPVIVVGFSVTIAAWALALALITLPAYNSALPKGGAELFGHVYRGEPTLAEAVVAGVVLALVSPYLTVGMAAIAGRLDRALLGPSRRGNLTARVSDLERSRSRMVAAADAERRRLERDLHDGAQARLVSLAMQLGRAKARFGDDPEGAAALVGQAHEEAKAALSELRSLVRGVHPPVLSDRGLDAALSGLAALCPIPVTVEVQMADRPSPTVEAIAYFVVAEALTNVAKHSEATTAGVHVRREGSTLRLIVRDDGCGGARPDGAGLAGLADRVQAVDGRLTVTSPPGGPTVIDAELPCES